MSESFVLFTKIIEVVRILTNEQKGILFQTILDYQESGEVPEDLDPVLKVAFLPIKHDMDVCAANRQTTIDKRREAGKKSAEKRANAEQCSTVFNSVEQCSTVLSDVNNNVNDNVNVNVNDNENVNVNENVTKLSSPLREKKRVEKQKEKPSKKKSTVYDPDEKLNQAILDFIEFRRSAKKPMTDNAIDLMLKKLRGMAADNDERIAILEQSVLNGWTGLYPLKAEKARGEPEDRFKVISDWLTGMEGNDDISGIC